MNAIKLILDADWAFFLEFFDAYRTRFGRVMVFATERIAAERQNLLDEIVGCRDWSWRQVWFTAAYGACCARGERLDQLVEPLITSQLLSKDAIREAAGVGSGVSCFFTKEADRAETVHVKFSHRTLDTDSAINFSFAVSPACEVEAPPSASTILHGRVCNDYERDVYEAAAFLRLNETEISFHSLRLNELDEDSWSLISTL